VSGLVDGHERNVSGSVTGRPDVPSLGLVRRDEGSGGGVQEGGLVGRLELVDPVLRDHKITRRSTSRSAQKEGQVRLTSLPIKLHMRSLTPA
jgi:hypothetical protein